MIILEPVNHAKSSGLKRDCNSAKKAGTINNTKTTKTPASCTEEVTVSAKSPKNSISL